MSSRFPLSAGADRRQAFLEALAHSGNVTEACGQSGLSRATAYRLRRADEAFAAAWSEARETGTDALEDEAVRRATQGVEEQVFYGGERVGTQRKYSDALLQFLLRARRPEQFRDRAAAPPAPADTGFRVVIRDENGNEIQPEPPDDE